jgi:hypothetical protein
MFLLFEVCVVESILYGLFSVCGELNGWLLDVSAGKLRATV